MIWVLQINAIIEERALELKRKVLAIDWCRTDDFLLGEFLGWKSSRIWQIESSFSVWSESLCEWIISFRFDASSKVGSNLSLFIRLLFLFVYLPILIFRATEDQALKVQSVLEKAEIIAQLCAEQKKKLTAVNNSHVCMAGVVDVVIFLYFKLTNCVISQKTLDHQSKQVESLGLYKKRLISEQRRSKTMIQINVPKLNAPELNAPELSVPKLSVCIRFIN